MSASDQVKPHLESPDEEVVFDPMVITHLGGRMDWKVDEMRTLANEVIVENTGQDPVRFVIEGVAVQSDLEDLLLLGKNYNSVRYVGEALEFTTTFDELRFDRKAENSHASKDGGDDEIDNIPVGPVDRSELLGDNPEPLYTFQLQNKQNESDDSMGPSIN